MKILIDMNLSPEWVSVLNKEGWESLHWREVGAPDAPDCEIMEWARDRGWVVFTHDLDFGALLAATGVGKPSVIQMRCKDPRPERMAEVTISALKAHEYDLEEGALITVDVNRKRVTLLPLKTTEIEPGRKGKEDN